VWVLRTVLTTTGEAEVGKEALSYCLIRIVNVVVRCAPAVVEQSECVGALSPIPESEVMMVAVVKRKAHARQTLEKVETMKYSRLVGRPPLHFNLSARLVGRAFCQH
jgi:hypothetical protein